MLELQHELFFLRLISFICTDDLNQDIINVTNKLLIN